uniref:Spike glycoprotein n=1 Tax=Murine coronavirus (strain JHM) TaxID=11144 RepID=SPIKE_CVMJH|nr:RecName: Full=Spike glycoprotein; Short=S glycoprotein; AltName: Full=E2; AltName: Full=Peplomer protein; Contains: RecName: Full=Spike protein S1; Contains: RecName: Full=Spike protein S2; Contains: RecName: Full=Spike protein S2'; Flags: Precursor [Murine hepatitis virus strain JHM]CAA28484.1 surface projection glycoprotein [Murine hepatitis virus]
MLFVFILLLPSCLGYIGDFRCIQTVNYNGNNASAPSISTEAVDVSKGRGTYYVLDRVYLNATLLLTGYYPVDGSNYRNLALTGTNTLSLTWFKPPFLSEFNDGIFAKVQNLKTNTPTGATSYFPTIVIGSLFGNTSYTVVLEPYNNIIMASVCTYTICQLPYTPCKPNTNGNRVIGFWHTDVKPPICLLKRNFTFNVNAPWLYFHFYQQGGTFYAYYADKPSATTFLFSVYIGDILTQYFVLPFICTPTAGSTLAPLYWVTPLLKRQYLFNFNEKGVITSAVDCASSYISEIKCKTQSLLPSTGVYDLSGYTVQPVGVVYRRVPNLPDCKIEEWLTAKSVPSPLNWERRTFQNCNFNLSSLLRYVQAESLSCNNIDASKVYGMCFGSVSVDKFAIPRSRQIDLQIGNSGFLQTANYKIDTAATSCQLYYSLPKNNVTINNYNPSSWNRRYGFKVNDRCQIFANILLNGINSGTTCSTDLQLPNTEVATGVCVRYDLYGITGQGVFKEVKADYYNSWQALLYDVNGNLNGFRDLTTNKTYTIRSCYSGRVSAAYHKEAPEPALLYRNINCSYVFTNNISREENPLNYFDSYLGCVVNADNRTDEALPNCNLRMGAGLCVDYSKSRRARRSVSTGYRLTTFEPYMPMLVNDSVQSVGGLYEMQIPTNFTIGHHEEFIQIRAPKVTIDCAAFVCGDNAACRQQLVEYGSFCDNVNAILNEVNNLLDNMQLQVASALMQGVTISSRLPDGISGPIDDINFSPLLGCIGSTCAEDGNGPSAIRGRSAIEDLLFDKVKLSDVGFVEAYNNCTGGQEVRDLLCVQSFNGIKVLPPVLSESQISGYTAGATAAAMFPPWTAAAGVPFSLNVQYRINGLGVTMNVLSENQKMIASAFNNALGAIQEGFDATNSALGKIQSVVNANAEALNNLLNQLSNRFGAISASLQEILTRLDAVEAKAQIDRLINGRLTALNAYISKQLSDSTLIKFSAAQAIEKVNECVKSQTTRINFCGNGNHILSLVQNAPYGLCFIHFSYVPTSFKTANVSPGLCISGDRGLAPKAGYFVQDNGEWKFTGSNYYYPEPITDKNSVAMISCAVNYTKAPEVFLNNSIPNLPDFKEELDKWFKNQTSIAPDLSLDFEKLNVTFLDLTYEMNRIQDAIKKLNESYINLKEVGTYEMYVKWPWYVWLLIGLAGVAVCVLLFFICCCTGCGSCCFRKCGSCCDEYGGHQDSIVIHNISAHED